MFEVDIPGLRQIVERRGVERVILELVSNALDEPGVTTIRVTLDSVARNRVKVIVEDDAPEGFVNLRDAWTLFGNTRKRGNAEVRGRFNLGEKLVIAACESASITTTTGCVAFANGERTRPRRTTEKGSVFEGTVRMTRDEATAAEKLMKSVLVPPGIILLVNEERVANRTPVAEASEILSTEVADEEGYLRRTARRTMVGVYRKLPSEVATIYEMGIPVVEIKGDHHVSIGQKVPLSMERDNVPPSYLRRVRAVMLNCLATVPGALDSTNASDPWVKDALESPTVEPEAVKAVIKAAYGDLVTTRDPRDPEAVKRCVSAGYAVIEPGAFSASAWVNIRRAQTVKPAGQIMATKPSGVAPTDFLGEGDLSPGMKACRELYQRLAWEVIQQEIQVVFVSAPTACTLATWVASTPVTKATFTLNVGTLGRAWFDRGCVAEVLDLALHEFAHEFSSDHCSAEYHAACTRLGGLLALAVHANPQILRFSVAGT